MIQIKLVANDCWLVFTEINIHFNGSIKWTIKWGIWFLVNNFCFFFSFCKQKIFYWFHYWYSKCIFLKNKKCIPIFKWTMNKWKFIMQMECNWKISFNLGFFKQFCMWFNVQKNWRWFSLNYENISKMPKIDVIYFELKNFINAVFERNFKNKNKNNFKLWWMAIKSSKVISIRFYFFFFILITFRIWFALNGSLIEYEPFMPTSSTRIHIHWCMRPFQLTLFSILFNFT